MKNLFFSFFVFSHFLLASENYQFFGKHFIANFVDCDEEALNDIATLSETLKYAAKESGATILSSSFHIFPPCGLTMVLLLSESHASIHTYPEHRSCFIDLFTCGETCDSTYFERIMEDYLKPKRIEKSLIIRKEPT